MVKRLLRKQCAPDAFQMPNNAPGMMADDLALDADYVQTDLRVR